LKIRSDSHEMTRARPAQFFAANGGTVAPLSPALLTQNGFFGRRIPDQ
jgi:hypothetical protein